MNKPKWVDIPINQNTTQSTQFATLAVINVNMMKMQFMKLYSIISNM